MTGRSSYQQTIQVLKSIRDGESPSQIKRNNQLSRYSYTYIVNRLKNHNLIKLQDDKPQVSKKGENVLMFLDETPKQPIKPPTPLHLR